MGVTDRLRAHWARIADDVSAGVAAGLILVLLGGAGTGIWAVVRHFGDDDPVADKNEPSELRGLPVITDARDDRAVSPLATPTPPPPTPVPGVPLSIEGELGAVNNTIKQKSMSIWIEAAPDDEVAMRLSLKNTGGAPITGLILRARVYKPDDVLGSLRVLDFTVRSASSGDEWSVPGASLVLEWPDENGCEFAVNGPEDVVSLIDVGDLQAEESGLTVPALDSWTSAAPEDVIVVAEYVLPEMAPASVLDLIGPVNISRLASGAHQIHGAPVELKLEGSDEEFKNAGQASIGDVLEVLIPLHNGSCVQGDPTVSVLGSIEIVAERGVATIDFYTDDPLGIFNPRRTRLSAATLNVSGSEKFDVSLVPGSTRLWESACPKPVEVQKLPDWLFQGGVSVAVPGFVPRMTCESHMRWITTKLEVERIS